MRAQRFSPWYILLPGLLQLACASSGATRFVHASADLGAIRNVAVLPFDTLTGNTEDGSKVQKIFLVELLALGAVEVVEPGRVGQLVAKEKLASAEKLAPADLQRIGEELGVDGLFLGTVLDFTEVRTGSLPTPEVTLQLRLVEVRSGTTAWSVTATRSGAGARVRLLGFGGDSLTETARKLIREQLEALVK
jgi:hypothetical protein